MVFVILGLGGKVCSNRRKKEIGNSEIASFSSDS